jgi:hypothetical protein
MRYHLSIPKYSVSFDGVAIVYAYKDNIFLDFYHACKTAKWFTAEDAVLAFGPAADIRFQYYETWGYFYDIWMSYPAMDPELIIEARKAFVQYYDREYWTYGSTRITQYYGSYNGCAVVEIMLGDKDAMHLYMVAGYGFSFGSVPDVNMIGGYKDGVYTELSHAYIAGWLTKEDIYDVWYNRDMKWNEENPAYLEYLPPPAGRDFTETLELAAIEHILRDYYEYRFPGRTHMQQYIGNYSECEIVRITKYRVTEREDQTEIAGYSIGAMYLDDLYAYKGSEFLLIAEAYEAGWLTEEDVADIGAQIDPDFWERNSP